MIGTPARLHPNGHQSPAQDYSTPSVDGWRIRNHARHSALMISDSPVRLARGA